VPVISQHGDVSLRRKIAQIDDGLHVAGENPVPEWFAEKIDLEMISSTRRCVEHINRSERHAK
jgi:hypothetical protein